MANLKEPPPSQLVVEPTRIWTPPLLHFIQQLVQRINAVEAAGWHIAVKTADESRSSTITLADDATLKFTVEANKKYAFRGSVFVTYGVTPQAKFDVNGPAAPALVRYHTHREEYGFSSTDTNDTAFAVSHGLDNGATTGQVDFEGILHNGANAGTVAFRWAQSVSNATATIVRAGSYLEYKEIA